MSEDREQKRRRRGGKKKQGRSKGKEFMDAAIDAFIRSQALLLWRDFIIYRDRNNKPTTTALSETGFFGDKGEYEAVWAKHWQAHVMGISGETDGELFGQIESAVRAAVLEEKATRLERGGPTLEDSDDYNAFIRDALGRLVADATAPPEV